MGDEVVTAGPSMLGLVVFLFFISLLVAAGIVAYLWYQKKHKYQRAADWQMLLVSVPKEHAKPREEQNAQNQDWREIVSVAEQMFASFASLYSSKQQAKLFGQQHLSFEIVAKQNEILFYVGCPKASQTLIEKTIYAFYPAAIIEESRDFRIFEQGLATAVATLKLAKSYVLPIKSYRQLESDPLNNMTNALSKLGETGRATIQILIRPTDEKWRSKIEEASKSVAAGKSIGGSTPQALKALQTVSSAINPKEEKKDENFRITPIQEEKLKSLSEKGSKSGFETVIRVVTAAPTSGEAQVYLTNIIAAFSQFQNPAANSFKYTKQTESHHISEFILRAFTGKPILLNTEELATIFHFPNQNVDTPNIRWLRAKRAPAPAGLPSEGLLIGENLYRGEHNNVFLKREDRRRHLYMIGMTGTGKSTLFEKMILQDIVAGEGVCLIDPHGESAERILAKIPRERAEDVIYFDPGDLDRPFGLNMLEWETPEQKDFLVQEIINIFYKLFDPNQTGIVGPQFEHWLRNAALTLMDWPEGGTLIEIPRLFTDDAYRDERVAQVKDPVVKAFWTQQMAKTADFHKSEMFNYFISKFGRFMTNMMMRNIIGQPKSSFNIGEAMNSGKILIVNLSKGKMGEVNANLIGMILVAKIYTAAMGRYSIPEDERRDFFLYVDEFQNLATDTFASILSEARKYRLALSITNQYISQLQEPIRDAIIGNVGTMISYRIGVPDAEFLEKEFQPVFNFHDLNNLERYNAYIKLLVDNTPTRPFSVKINKDESIASAEVGEAIRQLSRLKYGRDRGLVDAEIYERTKIVEVPEAKGTDPLSNA
jgi:hypothetical protein